MRSRLSMPEFEGGTVWLVGAGPGDPGLLTLHAVAALEQADVILRDALVPDAILALANPAARLELVGKRAGRPSARQLRISNRLVELAGEGSRVVRLKNGDPFVFGRGGEETLALVAASVPFRVVPGVTSGVAGPAYAGIPTTQRSVAQSVAFVTGHHAGGGGARSVDWAALAKGVDTIVVYMALRQIDTIAEALIRAGRPQDEPAALLTDATTASQHRIVTTLGDVAHRAHQLDHLGPTLLVIGQVVDLHQILSPLQQAEPATVAGYASSNRLPSANGSPT
ncbi:MAG: uroporphyrinogen-III C-methyltransferase [Geminicoccaceae bacterium]